MKRLLEIQKDCNREQYLAEVIIPVLKMCCLDGLKLFRFMMIEQREGKQKMKQIVKEE